MGFTALMSSLLAGGCSLAVFAPVVLGAMGIVLQDTGPARSFAALIAVLFGAWVFQIAFAMFEQDRHLLGRRNVSVVDRGSHGQRHWFELTDGMRVDDKPPHPTLDPDAELTPSGFELAVPNRRTTVRLVTRLLSTMAAATLLMLVLGMGLAGLGQQGLLLSASAFALMVLPGATVAGLRAWRRDTRRAREWTDRIRLDGALLTTDVGRITLQPGFTVERFEDTSGNGVTIRSGSDTLRFRAAWSALEWAVPRLQQARLAQGGAEEVPEALRRHRVATGIG